MKAKESKAKAGVCLASGLSSSVVLFNLQHNGIRGLKRNYINNIK